MAFAPDGLIEGFYDPDVYDPPAGKFIVGLQFHPERMRRFQEAAAVAKTTAAAFAAATAAEAGEITSLSPGEVFDYPECPRPYKEFVSAVVAYEKRVRPRVPMAVPMLPVDGPPSREGIAAGTGSGGNRGTEIDSNAAQGQEKAVEVEGSGREEGMSGVGVSEGDSIAPTSDSSGSELEEEKRRRAEVLRSFSFARVRYAEMQTTVRRNATERGASSALQVLQGGSVSTNGKNLGRKARREGGREEERELQVGADFLEVGRLRVT